MKLTIIIEKGEGELWGRIEHVPDYLSVTCGKNFGEIERNLRDLLDDYINNEESAYEDWKTLKASDIEFEYA